MSQLLTPEEVAALFEGMRAAEGGTEVAPSDSPQEMGSRRRGFPESPQISRIPDLSRWLLAKSALRWLYS